MTEDRIPESAEERRRREEEEDEDRGFFFWWFSTPAGRTGTAILVLALLIGAALFFNPGLRSKWLPGKQEVKVETQRWGSSVVFPIEGKDSAGKHAAFDVAVLPSDLSWVRRSASELSKAGTTIPESEAAQRIFTPELREGLGRSTGLIAVGLASQEGQVEEEAQRAARRATAAAGWVKAVFDEKTPIWTLNLGQFRGTCKATTEATDTGWQRPLIIVGIKSQDAGVNLGEAFADAISGKTNLPSRDCYTNFDLTKFR
jgi:hypothetical protein